MAHKDLKKVQATSGTDHRDGARGPGDTEIQTTGCCYTSAPRDGQATNPSPAMSGFALARQGTRAGLILPAAMATVASYFLMNMLISVEFEEPVIKPMPVLEAVTPSRQTTEPRRSPRNAPQRLPEASQPPPPPQLSASKSDIDLPTVNIQGAAPAQLEFGSLNMLAIAPVTMTDRGALPISPPVPQYPQRAAERGIEGDCEVNFDVSARGEPYNIRALCSDSIFVRSAEQAVSRVRFAPKIVRGQPVERSGVVYPIVYSLDE